MATKACDVASDEIGPQNGQPPPPKLPPLLGGGWLPYCVPLVLLFLSMTTATTGLLSLHLPHLLVGHCDCYTRPSSSPPLR